MSKLEPSKRKAKLANGNDVVNHARGVRTPLAWCARSLRRAERGCAANRMSEEAFYRSMSFRTKGKRTLKAVLAVFKLVGFQK